MKKAAFSLTSALRSLTGPPLGAFESSRARSPGTYFAQPRPGGGQAAADGVSSARRGDRPDAGQPTQDQETTRPMAKRQRGGARPGQRAPLQRGSRPAAKPAATPATPPKPVGKPERRRAGPRRRARGSDRRRGAGRNRLGQPRAVTAAARSTAPASRPCGRRPHGRRRGRVPLRQARPAANRGGLHRHLQRPDRQLAPDRRLRGRQGQSALGGAPGSASFVGPPPVPSGLVLLISASRAGAPRGDRRNCRPAIDRGR